MFLVVGNNIGVCTALENCPGEAAWQRQATAYTDDSQNWIYVCDSCLDRINEGWAERWDEYYSSIR